MINRLYCEILVGKIASSGYFEKVSAISSLIDTIPSDEAEGMNQAIAAFDAPAGAGEVMPQDVKEQLQPVLTSSWHTAA